MAEPARWDAPVDVLSPLAREVLRFNVESAYEQIVVRGPGNAEALQRLKPAKPSDLLSVPIRSAEDAEAMLSALWLWHDWLDASHAISQGLPSATGSFWHAIMHRREGDFGNSKYWYARCRNHPILQVISAQANPIMNKLPADRSILRLTLNGWSPDAFVDLAQAAHDDPNHPHRPLVVSLQQLEWRLLFDHCVRQAGGGAGVQTFNPQEHGG